MTSLDLSATLDVVNIELLILRLQRIDLPDDVISLVGNWLSLRYFYVSVDGNRMSRLYVTGFYGADRYIASFTSPLPKRRQFLRRRPIRRSHNVANFYVASFYVASFYVAASFTSPVLCRRQFYVAASFTSPPVLRQQYSIGRSRGERPIEKSRRKFELELLVLVSWGLCPHKPGPAAG